MRAPDLHTAAAFEAFGARVRILASPVVADELHPALPPGAAHTSGGTYDTTYQVTTVDPAPGFESCGFELSRDGTVVGRSRSLEKVRLEIESDVHFRIACFARGFLFVHAGVVEWKDRVIVLPGRSMSGKSTLVLALVRAGARYFSDEFAIIDPQGLVLPYAKPLSERRKGIRPRLHASEDLGAVSAGTASPIGTIALLQFRHGAQWSPRPLSRSAAVLRLFDNTVVAQTDPEFALALLARAVSGADALEGERGDSAETALRLLNA
jgi:hypothetical protein